MKPSFRIYSLISAAKLAIILFDHQLLFFFSVNYFK